MLSQFHQSRNKIEINRTRFDPSGTDTEQNYTKFDIRYIHACVFDMEKVLIA